MIENPKQEIRAEYGQTTVLIVGPLLFPGEPVNDVRITVDVTKLCNLYARKAAKSKGGKCVMGNGAVVVSATGPMIVGRPYHMRSAGTTVLHHVSEDSEGIFDSTPRMDSQS